MGSPAVVSPVTRRRLEIQGFIGLSDESLREVGPWLRFTPALCTGIVMIGTVLALPALLWVLVPIALFGAVFPRHPFDYIYNIGLRRLTGTRPLPANGASAVRLRHGCGVDRSDSRGLHCWLRADRLCVRRRLDRRRLVGQHGAFLHTVADLSLRHAYANS